MIFSRPQSKRIVSLTVITLLALLAQSNLIEVYGNLAMWAVAAIPATAVGALIALTGAHRALMCWWQLVLLALSQFVIGPVIALPSTTIAHVIPSTNTLSQGWEMTFGAFKYLIAIEPPIGIADGSLMAVWTIGLWMTFLAGVFAIYDHQWLPLASALPLATSMAVCALLGADSGWQRPICGIAFTLIFTIWVSWRLKLLEWRRWACALIIVILAVGLAFGGTMMVAQRRLVLRDHYNPPPNPYAYTSPLSGIRSYIKDHKDDTLLTVANLPAGTPIRLAVMDRFDGSVWNLSDSAKTFGSSNYQRVGTSINADEQGMKFTATFTVNQGLSNPWLPLAGAATSVQFTNIKDIGPFYYNSDTDSAMLSSGISTGLTYIESGIIAETPTEQQISEAKAAHISQPPAREVPDSVSKLATAIAGGQSSGGAAAQELATTLQESGWFSHGLSGDYPSDAGHGNYRVNKLLTGTAMVGDSEQYASAMALMARELGLPSRVVLGFLPKDEDGVITDARTKETSSNGTITEFTGNDMTAWVEIKLQHWGWVAFHPTPQESKIPDDSQHLSPPNPKTLVRQPPVPLTNPLRDQIQAKGQSSLTGENADAPSTNLFWARFRYVARQVVMYGSPIWAMLIVCGLILAGKALILVRAQRHGSPQMRMASGWNAVLALAVQSGITASGTRRNQAQAMAQQFATDNQALHQLSTQADYAVFSGQKIRPAQAAEYWTNVMRLRKSMLASLPRLRRITTRLSLRNVIIGAPHRSRAKSRRRIVMPCTKGGGPEP